MKKFAKFFMAAMMVATVGFVACSKDDNKKSDDNPNPSYTESATFDILHDGDAIASGDTVYNESFIIHFYVKNLTSENQNACFKVEYVSGPAAMKMLTSCIEVCYDPEACPFSKSFTVNAQGQQELEFKYMEGGVDAGSTAVYRLTVGKGNALEDAQVIFFTLKV